ncbi:MULTISPECIES: hypothetical protein [Pseudomonas]|jgi:hypothetical protein|uniref:Uncharacterized protein n=5 Tax=Pseudomonas TaxID=286 RepID=Q88KL6_PSEPK|nr:MULTISPECIES: hypothetical protein [Pseudomonas]WPE27933.1 hypothetical protein PshuTeo1_36600 [Pseudomonas hunanensis]AAN67887.1 conserved protein of unknown function [Pseudomonas putida KT2440]ANI04445.1 hypothetical protein A210_17890 [Pseudomonas putida SJTE-1]EGB99553.1 hypothetical protein G1E_07748 [Pseudomonas sp. TJI-51]KIC81061.1 hypothetical protein RR51_18130 [Pseudomonas sp. C5pp]
MTKDPVLLEVLYEAFKSPFKIQSDFARFEAQAVASLASLGLLSTLEGHGQYGRKWRVTGTGLDLLRENDYL